MKKIFSDKKRRKTYFDLFLGQVAEDDGLGDFNHTIGLLFKNQEVSNALSFSTGVDSFDHVFSGVGDFSWRGKQIDESEQS